MPPASDRHVVRQFLKERFPSDEEFDAFCAAWFRDIAERFAPGMDRTLKTNLLFSAVEPDVVLECASRSDAGTASVRAELERGRVAPGSTGTDADSFRQRARTEAELQLLVYHRQVLERYGAGTDAIDEKIKQKQSLLKAPNSHPGVYPGARLDDKYILIERIGEGSLGSVWHAQSLLHSPRYVAIKIVAGKPMDSDVIRLGRAANVLGRLAASPYVPMLHEGPCQIGEDLHYIVLEYLAGGSLHERLRSAKLAGSALRDDDPVAQERLRTRAAALRGILQAGEALAYAHSMGTTHRNIHPGNILFDGLGAAKVTDFDSARTADRPRSEAYSHGLMRYRFSSPEKRTGASLIDARSDVYSLGMVTIVALVLTSRARPVNPDTLDLSPESLRSLLPRVDVLPEASEMLLRAVAPDPSRRFRTMTEFCTELQRSCQHILDAADALAGTPAANPMATTLRRLPSLPSSEPASGTGRSRPPADLRRTTLRNFPFRYSGADDGRISGESQRSQPPSTTSNPAGPSEPAEPTEEEYPAPPPAADDDNEDPTAISPMPDAQSWADLADLVSGDAASREAAAGSAGSQGQGSAAAAGPEDTPPDAGAAPAAPAAPAALGAGPADPAHAAAASPPGEDPRHRGAAPATAVPVVTGPVSGGDGESAFDTLRDDGVWVQRGAGLGALRQQLSASPLLAVAVVVATLVNLLLLGIVVWLLGRGQPGPAAPQLVGQTPRPVPSSGEPPEGIKARPQLAERTQPTQPTQPAERTQPRERTQPTQPVERPQPTVQAPTTPPAPPAPPAAPREPARVALAPPAPAVPSVAPTPAAPLRPSAPPPAAASAATPREDQATADAASGSAAAPAPPKPKVSRQLCVASDPGLAEITVDSKSQGKTPADQSAPRCISVPAAKFTLRLRRDGYKPFVFGVTRDSAWVTQTDKQKGDQKAEQKQVIVITPKLSPETPATP